jgi:hypothetical protein
VRATKKKKQTCNAKLLADRPPESPSPDYC